MAMSLVVGLDLPYICQQPAEYVQYWMVCCHLHLCQQVQICSLVEHLRVKFPLSFVELTMTPRRPDDLAHLHLLGVSAMFTQFGVVSTLESVV